MEKREEGGRKSEEFASPTLPSFTPAWWLPGPHWQTIGGRMLRSRRGVTLRRESIDTADRDFLDLDFAAVEGRSLPADAPLALVLHGLEGSARSKYVLELHRVLAARGMAGVGLNFRSCGGRLNRAPRLYHSGETGDLALALDHLAARYPQHRRCAVGFSLGGNVLLKYLGERAESARARLEAAVAISVPFDLSAGADQLERGFARVYRWKLVRSLRAKVRAKAGQLDGRVDLGATLAARTFRQFDDAATAPLHGFRDAEDYYGRSSSQRYLASIAVPTLLLHSLDDPFLPAAAVPRNVACDNPYLSASFTERGGHVGFVAGPPWKPVFWAEQAAAGFLERTLCRPLTPAPALPDCTFPAH
ncbi:MAG: alpha/beta fold hydrolase [Gemmatimonadetes bacterium]|nr:alpha/beta fold hydrolase [Gemmatimonadota bacterium]